MTTILIPTDFSLESVRTGELAARALNRPVSIIFFHAFEMPFYYHDMIRNDQPPHMGLLTDELRQACFDLKNRPHQLIKKIGFRFMQGTTPALFRNFADAHGIDIIACDQDYKFRKIHARSVNPIPLFRKSGLPLLNDFSIRRTNLFLAPKKKQSIKSLTP